MNLPFFEEIKLLKILEHWRILAPCFKWNKSRGAWLVQSIELATLDREVVSSSPTLGIKIFKKEKKLTEQVLKLRKKTKQDYLSYQCYRPSPSFTSHASPCALTQCVSTFGGFLVLRVFFPASFGFRFQVGQLSR